MFERERQVLQKLEAEGSTISQCIRKTIDDITEEIAKNPNYVAFNLLDDDPLNSNSVESLCSQADILHEQAVLRMQAKDLDPDLEAKYSKIAVRLDDKFTRNFQGLIFVGDSSAPSKLAQGNEPRKVLRLVQTKRQTGQAMTEKKPKGDDSKAIKGVGDVLRWDLQDSEEQNIAAT